MNVMFCLALSIKGFSAVQYSHGLSALSLDDFGNWLMANRWMDSVGENSDAKFQRLDSAMREDLSQTYDGVPLLPSRSCEAIGDEVYEKISLHLCFLKNFTLNSKW